jgi:hypothetical protein
MLDRTLLDPVMITPGPRLLTPTASSIALLPRPPTPLPASQPARHSLMALSAPALTHQGWLQSYEAAQKLEAAQAALVRRPFWLRFTYVTSVLVKKY